MIAATMTVPAADLLKLAQAVVKAKERVGMPNAARVVPRYPACKNAHSCAPRWSRLG